MIPSNKPPLSFWAISIIALIWNLFGVIAYLIRAFATNEMIESLPEDQQAEFLIDFPAWYTAAFALAVFIGVAACLALLIRKRIAYPLFIISFLSALAQHLYLFINVEIPNMVMPVLVLLVGLFLIWFSKNSISKGWLR